MRRPPRDPKAAIFDRPLVFRLAYQGLLIALCTLAAYRVGCMASIACGQTMAFAVLSGSQIVHSFNLRSNTRSLFSRGPQNRWMFLAGRRRWPCSCWCCLCPSYGISSAWRCSRPFSGLWLSSWRWCRWRWWRP